MSWWHAAGSMPRSSSTRWWTTTPGCWRVFAQFGSATRRLSPGCCVVAPRASGVVHRATASSRPRRCGLRPQLILLVGVGWRVWLSLAYSGGGQQLEAIWTGGTIMVGTAPPPCYWPPAGNPDGSVWLVGQRGAADDAAGVVADRGVGVDDVGSVVFREGDEPGHDQ